MAYWAQRASFLEHLATEARQSLAGAEHAARLAGVPAEEVRSRLPVSPLTSGAVGAAGGGGFVFAYAESGPDGDGDGDVDGGLFDTISNLFD